MHNLDFECNGDACIMRAFFIPERAVPSAYEVA